MPLFRKRPVVIEADRVAEAIRVETLEGVLQARPGDWIIKGVKGERYPCKDDVFRKTYEPIDADGVRALAARLPEQVDMPDCIPFPGTGRG